MADPSSIAGGGEFPVTSWSLIVRLQGSSDDQRARALETLCRRYWKPVCHFIRRAWAKTPDDAKDLTQAFFLQLLEGDALRRYSPDRGGFRTYLKVILRGFAADQRDAMLALKRGGGARVFTLDDDGAPLRDIVADPSAASPEQAFDWQWKKEILERAIERAPLLQRRRPIQAVRGLRRLRPGARRQADLRRAR